MRGPRSSCLAWLGLVLWGLAASAGAQYDPPAWNIEIVGQVGGGCMGVQSDGDFVYIGEGPNVTVLDVRTTTNPLVVARLRFGGVIGDVYLADDYVYAAGWTAGLQVIDVTDPENPRIAGSYPMNAYSVHVNGNRAFVGRSFGGVEILDVSSHSTPTKTGSIDLPFLFENIWTSGSLTFLATMSAGLIVIDTAHPTTPTIESYFVGVKYPFDVVTSGNLVYVSGEDLYIADYANLTTPSLLTTYTLNGNGLGMFLQEQDERVYVGTTSGTLEIVDVSDPSSPTALGSWDGAVLPVAVYAVGTTIYVCDAYRGLYVLDASEPSTPVVAGFYGTPIGCHVIRTPSASKAYIAAYDFYTLDINNPASPTVFNIFETDHELAGVDISGNLAFLTHEKALDLLIVNIGDPSNPVLVGTYETQGERSATSPVAEGSYPDYVGPKVDVKGNKAIISGFTSGSLEFLDVGDPASATLVGTYPMPGLVGDIDIQGGTGFFAHGEDGLEILNVSNPGNVKQLDNFTSAWALSFKLSDVTGYIGDGGKGGIWIVNLGDPSSATLEGHYPTTGPVYGIDESGRIVFTASDKEGLLAIDVSDPTSPTLVGYFRSEGVAVDVRFHGGLIYLADKYSGMWILRFIGPRPPPPPWWATARPSWRLYR